jgi:hypothetical protein
MAIAFCGQLLLSKVKAIFSWTWATRHGSGQLSPNIPLNWNTMRGDLELLNLSPQSTSVKYYSG